MYARFLLRMHELMVVLLNLRNVCLIKLNSQFLSGMTAFALHKDFLLLFHNEDDTDLSVSRSACRKIFVYWSHQSSSKSTLPREGLSKEKIYIFLHLFYYKSEYIWFKYFFRLKPFRALGGHNFSHV